MNFTQQIHNQNVAQFQQQQQRDMATAQHMHNMHVNNTRPSRRTSRATAPTRSRLTRAEMAVLDSWLADNTSTARERWSVAHNYSFDNSHTMSDEMSILVRQYMDRCWAAM